MPNMLVLYYSSWGHVETMAYAQAEGVARVGGMSADVKRVPELVPEPVAKQFHYKLDQKAPLADPLELRNYEGIIFGAPTRFGNMCAQMRNFLDQTGPLFAENALVGKVGSEVAHKVRELSIGIYELARSYAATRGIIIADTKFEFGLSDGKLILIDEVLTPDSSRFWPADHYVPGKGQPSFDKQFVRDYLETLDWNKQPPGPKLPDAVVSRTSEKYLEAYERLTGRKL